MSGRQDPNAPPGVPQRVLRDQVPRHFHHAYRYRIDPEVSTVPHPQQEQLQQNYSGPDFMTFPYDMMTACTNLQQINFDTYHRLFPDHLWPQPQPHIGITVPYGMEARSLQDQNLLQIHSETLRRYHQQFSAAAQSQPQPQPPPPPQENRYIPDPQEDFTDEDDLNDEDNLNDKKIVLITNSEWREVPTYLKEHERLCDTQLKEQRKQMIRFIPAKNEEVEPAAGLDREVVCVGCQLNIPTRAGMPCGHRMFCATCTALAIETRRQYFDGSGDKPYECGVCRALLWGFLRFY